jgi:penicillin-binding protein activator
MKKHIMAASVCATLLLVVSCSSNTQVTRVDPATQTDLSGYWNDTDVRIVCETLIGECLASARVAQFQKTTGKVPVFIVGTFRNDSDEHIDTSIITKKMEAAILNSGKAEFVASKSERSDIRDERQEQQSWASEETAKALANELGADFMLIGSVKTIVDRSGDGKTRTRTYYVYGELIDVETGRKVWIGENADIKKILKNSSTRF